MSTGGMPVTLQDGEVTQNELASRNIQRFYRLDASRTTPGNGLGLSLVAAVASLHGIEIVLGDNRPGLRTTLKIPALARSL